jgi:hypothetical protein
MRAARAPLPQHGHWCLQGRGSLGCQCCLCCQGGYYSPLPPPLSLFCVTRSAALLMMDIKRSQEKSTWEKPLLDLMLHTSGQHRRVFSDCLLK